MMEIVVSELAKKKVIRTSFGSLNPFLVQLEGGMRKIKASLMGSCD